jgi:hypothetical protein
MQVMKAIANHDLETKVVGLSADNTDTNLEGLLRRCKENVFSKIKSRLNRNISVLAAMRISFTTALKQPLTPCL